VTRQRSTLRVFFLFLFDRGRLLAKLGSVLRFKLFLQFGIAQETLRLGAGVLIAPVTFILAFGRVFRAALAANVLGDAVFSAPPTAVVVTSLGMRVAAFAVCVLVEIRLVRRGGGGRRWCRLVAPKRGQSQQGAGKECRFSEF
jgi:hypothetical protein